MNFLQKASVPIVLGLLITWILFGMQLYHRVCCATTPDVPLSVTDGVSPVIATPQNLKFGLSVHEPVIPKAVNAALPNLASHLQNNSDKVLLLTGQYRSDEKNTSNFDNLGIGRAEALKAKLVTLGAPAEQILTKGEINKLLIAVADTVYNGLNFNINPIPYYHLDIQDGTRFSENIKDNLVFPISGFDYKKPLMDSLQNVYQLTAEYLKKSPNRTIFLTGLYKDNETNNSVYPTLGLARANAAKKILTDLNVPGKQIITKDSLMNSLIFQKNTLTGGIIYSFNATKTEEEGNNELADLKARLQAAPIILYFQTNANSLQLSATQRQQFADLNKYLSLVPTASATVTGHTDNRGNRNYNINLARERANFAKNYLVNNGINTNQMKTTSKGPDQPIETNNTEAGRAKNRRVEVTLN